MLDLEATFRRIGFRGQATATIGTLAELQRAFTLAVPFENLDLHLGRPLRLDPAWLHHKIVDEGRGGLCYELNGYFGAVLAQMGFGVTFLGVSLPAADGSGWTSPFVHVALCVEVGEGTGVKQVGPSAVEHGEPSAAEHGELSRGEHGEPSRVGCREAFLVDVGFGDAIRAPIRLVGGVTQTDGWDEYRLERRASGDWQLLVREPGGDWMERQRFDERARSRSLGDFSPACEKLERDPGSLFRKGFFCCRVLPEGRITLTDQRLVVTGPEGRRERLVRDQAAFEEALHTHFGLGYSEVKETVARFP